MNKSTVKCNTPFLIETLTYLLRFTKAFGIKVWKQLLFARVSAKSENTHHWVTYRGLQFYKFGFNCFTTFKKQHFFFVGHVQSFSIGGQWSVWPDWTIYWILGNFSKPVATISLAKSPIFLGNFLKGVKIFNFSSEIILGNFYRHLVTFNWSHWPPHTCCR